MQSFVLGPLSSESRSLGQFGVTDKRLRQMCQGRSGVMPQAHLREVFGPRSKSPSPVTSSSIWYYWCQNVHSDVYNSFEFLYFIAIAHLRKSQLRRKIEGSEGCRVLWDAEGTFRFTVHNALHMLLVHFHGHPVTSTGPDPSHHISSYKVYLHHLKHGPARKIN